MMQSVDTRIMSIDPAPVLHRFVSLANESDYLALGWMRERPLKSMEHIEKPLGVWLMWPCLGCAPVEAPLGSLCGGRWPRVPTH
jgi:hypothetical protein